MRKGTAAKSLETGLVPIVGEAPAGQLMPAEENMLGQVQMPKEFRNRPARIFFFFVFAGIP